MSEPIRLKHNGWVVVADGTKALFLRNAGDEKFPNLEIFKKETQDNPPNREQMSDRPGRLSDGSNGHRSAVSEADWHALAESGFASDLADMLYKRAHKGKFDEIVLVAAPSVLGEVRKHLHKEVTSRVIAEIGKDLTNHPVDKIEKLVLASG
ncbi:host attachment family protein [Roseibium aggregatum]|uniref:Host attachment protein n=1 Tax=Roseibium aggregatum TaxID=187304 RepID=A0A939J6P7_9HYPH|nr:host attachment family protein [Roseibium aggregatum]MBN9673962.1 host attachment protein [Roseibium aggregatum]